MTGRAAAAHLLHHLVIFRLLDLALYTGNTHQSPRSSFQNELAGGADHKTSEVPIVSETAR